MAEVSPHKILIDHDQLSMKRVAVINDARNFAPIENFGHRLEAMVSGQNFLAVNLLAVCWQPWGTPLVAT
jgi:hypothetical protein